jgi:hypothetical protein
MRLKAKNVTGTVEKTKAQQKFFLIKQENKNIK